MQKAFIKLTTLFVIIGYNIGESSQYGGDYRTADKTENHVVSRQPATLAEVKTTQGNDKVILFMGEMTIQHFNILVQCYHGNNVSINVSVVENAEILKINGPKCHTFLCLRNDSVYEAINNASDVDNTLLNANIVVQKRLDLELDSVLIGQSRLVFELDVIDTHDVIGTHDVIYNGSLPVNASVEVEVLVIKDIQAIDIAFLISIYALEILEMLTFGTQLDLDIVKHTLKTPVPILIGLMCQYVGMPLISFAIAKAVAPDSLSAFGIFVAGVCPGGGSSNIYAYLLDGDLSLSITMTTLSTVLSLVMLPLWLYTLGSAFLQANSLDIPYVDILQTLSMILVPLSLGLFIRNKFPKVSKIVEKTMTVVLTVLALILITTGVISCMYLFKMFNWMIVLIGCLLPYIGFCLGAVVAFIFRQPKKTIKTVAIETGMQNTGIAIILLVSSFPTPFGDIATVAPMAAEVMSPIPPFFASIVYLIWKFCCKKYEEVELTDTEERSASDKLRNIYEIDEEFDQNHPHDITKALEANDTNSSTKET